VNQRVAGQQARIIQRQKANHALAWLGVAVGVFFLMLVRFGLGWITVGVEVWLVAAMFAIDVYFSPIVARWGQGAAGEELVGQVVDGLRPSGWCALHDVNLGRGNIDHVLIGPAGIFTIETKSHRGRINSDMIEGKMLKQAYAEAKAIERITGLHTEPLLVFSNAYLTRAVSKHNGVLVLPARMLAGHLARRAPTLSAERVAEIYARLAAALPA